MKQTASGAGAACLRANIKVIMNGRMNLSMVLFSGKTSRARLAGLLLQPGAVDFGAAQWTENAIAWPAGRV